MDARGQAIAEVARYCDVEERLPLIPASAMTRGMYFRSIDEQLAAAGKADRFREIFPKRYAALGWYPTREFLCHLTVGAGELLDPARVHEGMFELGRRNARAFADGVLGKLMLRVLARDPVKILKQGLAARRQSAKPARWELEFPDERTAVMDLIQEYAYIESYELGAAHGTFEAIDVPVRIECTLQDRFVGKHVLRW